MHLEISLLTERDLHDLKSQIVSWKGIELEVRIEISGIFERSACSVTAYSPS